MDGRIVKFPEQHTYLALHKPVGYISTRKDTHGRSTVMDLVPAHLRDRLYPVGRLDINAEGLIFLFDDGELANHLLHPRYEVPKTYHVMVEGEISPEAVKRLEHGVVLEDGPTAPAQAEIVRQSPGRTLLALTIHEGRKHQVKRMCDAVGHPVTRLIRVAIDGVRLGELRPGRFRSLTPEELQSLRRAAGLEAGS